MMTGAMWSTLKENGCGQARLRSIGRPHSQQSVSSAWTTFDILRRMWSARPRFQCVIGHYAWTMPCPAYTNGLAGGA